ncbi:MAG: flavodoxin domain-containing protein, partial [Alphaproteobacteria bacterium]|nr:flavodoxin domain-containing protein [Alphaproteobacteria bacterium]
MTAFEFPGPGFTAEQWNQINALATSLGPGQGLWLSGYFAGLDHNARAPHTGAGLPLATLDPMAPLLAATPSTRSLTILFGSETGNGAGLAKALGEAAARLGVEPTVVDMADYKLRRLKDEQDLLIVTSTHGEGDPPLSGKGFFEFVEGRKAPHLPDLRYAILALGDSTYEHYCGAGKRLDRRLEELGAARLAARVDCDVDYDEDAAGWIKAVVAKLTPPAQAGNGGATARAVGLGSASATPTPAFDKRKPFPATVIENLVLTGRGSSKETRHIELSLAGSGLAFEPGDALGVLPRNDPSLVESLLDTLRLSADTPLSLKERKTT